MDLRKLTVTDWHKFRELSRAEKALLLQAAVMILLVSAAHRRISVKRLHACLSLIARPGAGGENGSGQMLSAQAVARIVQVAVRRGLTRPSCLPHALVLWTLLQRHGHDARIRFGVRRGEGGLESHAWVAHHGKVLNDAHDVGSRFTPFPAEILPGG